MGTHTTIQNAKQSRPWRKIGTFFGRPGLGRVRTGRQILAAIALGWLPLIALALLASGQGRIEPLVHDPSVHVRLLVAIPLILLAAKVLDRLGDRVMDQLRREQFILSTESDRYARLCCHQRVLREAWLADAVLGAIALIIGIANLTGRLPVRGAWHPTAPLELTPGRVWYSIITLPLFQFVVLRGLWRLAVWAYFIGALSRYHLLLSPAHPDQRTGLGFLKRPSLMYGAILLFALSCVTSAAWAPSVFTHRAHLHSLGAFVLLLFLVGFGLALAPMLLFLPRLINERLAAREQYGGLATDYARDFHAGWITRRSRGELLGNSDFQSMNDLSQTFRNNVEEIHPFLFGRRDLALLAVATLLPLVPLLLAQMPLPKLLATFAHVALGIK